MPATYAVRDGGDAKSKKQSMADLKLRRLQELNSRLKEDLERPRVKVAEASMRYVAQINYFDAMRLLTLGRAVSSTTATKHEITWYLPSGARSTEKKIHTIHNLEVAKDAAVSCN